MLRILRPSPVDLSGFQNQTYAPPSSHLAPSGSSEINKVIFALGTLTSVMQNINSKIQEI